jgi:adenosylcobinamide kinase/adenosylcobinamide-phosphate guanylyltransferase
MSIDGRNLQIALITGPARSGKSEWAEHLAQCSGKSVIYVATGRTDPEDADWQARLAQHRARRPADWGLWEVPMELAAAISQATAHQCLLVDSLGTWLANLIDLSDAEWQRRQSALLVNLQAADCEVILVGEETGWGVVPAYPVGRRFRDRLGGITRQIGAIATSVYLVTGGYALDLKALGQPLPPQDQPPQ